MELKNLRSIDIKLDINVKMEGFVVKKIIFLLYWKNFLFFNVFVISVGYVVNIMLRIKFVG